MGYAKEFGIPRSLMYDENSDINNPMFDLNRELLAEDKNITVLTPTKIQQLIKNIREKDTAHKKQIQKSLFD